MPNKKHYILTSVTLGLIGAASALLIGGSNMITKERIAQNEINKINSGIAEIFGNSSSIANEADLAYEYANHVYEIKAEEPVGYAFKTSGSNMYGKVSLIVGFNLDKQFKQMVVVTNEQTYAQALMDNYINPLNNGSKDNIDDVTCGATYGAKLVRDMIKDAQKALEEEAWKK